MFDDFIKWTTTRTVRTTGKPPAANTLISKAARLRQACSMLDPVPGSPAELAGHLGDREKAEALLDCLYANHAANTVVVDLTVLREFGVYAVAKRWIASCALTASDSPRGRFQKPIETYTVAEVDRLLLFAEVRGSLRHYMLLATVAETGRRISEILGLRWDDLRLTETPPHLTLPTSKNGKQQIVPLTTRLREDVFTEKNLARLRASTPHKWATKSPDVYLFTFSYNAANEWLHGLCERAGVKPKGWHILRHTYVTRKLGQGVPIQAVSKLVGHSSVRVTDALYNHCDAFSFMEYVD
jgi:integrase